MNFPPEIKAKEGKRLQHCRCKFYHSSSGILLGHWQDKKAKKPVIAVSTKYTEGKENVTGPHGKVTIKPSIIHQYNHFVNGCDHMDPLVSYYNSLDRKTIKWWKRMFQWLGEVSQCNA